MMKITIISSILISSCFIGCGGKSTAPAPEAVVAKDNAKLLEALKLADTAGTVKEALTDAATDSSLRDKMELALGLPTHHGSPHATASKEHKDILDKSSDALDVANEKVTKSGVVLDKASQVKDKAGNILHR